jgi:hypothetical protein
MQLRVQLAEALTNFSTDDGNAAEPTMIPVALVQDAPEREPRHSTQLSVLRKYWHAR